MTDFAKFLCILFCAVIITTGSFANAATFGIDTVDGDWTNPVADPASGSITISNSDDDGGLSTARWGSGTEQSGYDFLSASTPFDVESDGALFALGEFTHHNFPITGTVLDSIDLNIYVEDLGIFDVSATFGFDHNETPNVGGTPASNDIVTILNPVVNSAFTYLGDEYFFNLLGFSQDGGTTVTTSFSTIEGQSNTAGLYAKITSNPVPEPSTMLLFGTGLAGLVGVGRKKFFKKS